MANSFTVRRLRFTLILDGANSVFPGTNSNTLVLEGMRASVVAEATARQPMRAEIQIYGMREEDMDALTVVWANPPAIPRNTVIVEASTGTTWTQVFTGTMKEAMPDYSQLPNVSFSILALTGYREKINPAPPTSYTQPTPLRTIVEELARKMEFTPVVAPEVDAVLDTPYFWGTNFDQFAAACAAGRADFYILGNRIVVTPRQRPASQTPSVLLSPATGLIGYPQFSQAGLEVTAIYDPAFACATPLDIDGKPPAARGRWYPYQITHQLDARTAGGQWTSYLKCLRVL